MPALIVSEVVTQTESSNVDGNADFYIGSCRCNESRA